VNNNLGWRKSSRSNDQTLGCCVEVAATAPGRRVFRDSKDPQGPKLSLSTAELGQLVKAIKNDTL
jgi:hypothetical protein